MMRISILAFVAVVMLAGCGSDEPASGPAASPIGLYEPTGEGGDAALLTGRLDTTDGCYYVVADGARYLPVFPTGSAETDGGSLTYRGQSFGNGDELTLVGGESPADAVAITEAQIPSCAAKNVAYWIVAQSDGIDS